MDEAYQPSPVGEGGPFMVDEELLVGLNKVKHLIRHTHDARMPPSPTGEGLFRSFCLLKSPWLRQYSQHEVMLFAKNHLYLLSNL